MTAPTPTLVRHLQLAGAVCFLTSLLTTALAIPAKYRAAVYEHVVISPINAEGNFTRTEAFDWMSKNLDIYETQIKKAASLGVKIIVFPEYGITGFDHTRDSIIPFLEDIPDEKARWNPCTEPERFAKTLVLNRVSCLARNHRIYVVVNMGDIKPCDRKQEASCPVDGRYQFNTNVVFDDSGLLVSRYHKFNMYDETPLFDPAPEVEYAIFETPFGKFGTTVCFDLLHYYPTQVLLEIMGINNLLITSAWNVFYPFVMPIQMYAGLAKRNNINVIASNIRNKEYVMASSGIFGHDVDAHSEPDFNDSDGELVVADVLNTAGGKNMDAILETIQAPTKNDFAMTTQHTGMYDYGMNMTFTILADNSTFSSVCARESNLCCLLEYRFKYHDPNELFILSISEYKMVYPGRIHMQFCAVHRCQTSDLDTCGGVTQFSHTTFSYIKLQANLNNTLLYPFVTTSPYNNITYNMEMENYSFDKTRGILESDKFVEPLLAAVIFNTVDEEEVQLVIAQSTGGSEQVCAPLKGLTISVVIICVLWKWFV